MNQMNQMNQIKINQMNQIKMNQQSIINKLCLEIFKTPPTKKQNIYCINYLYNNNYNIKNLVEHLINNKYKIDLEKQSIELNKFKKYKKKYKELKEVKTTEYELIQLSKQYKEILDDKDKEIRYLRNKCYDYYDEIKRLQAEIFIDIDDSNNSTIIDLTQD